MSIFKAANELNCLRADQTQLNKNLFMFTY